MPLKIFHFARTSATSDNCSNFGTLSSCMSLYCVRYVDPVHDDAYHDHVPEDGAGATVV